MKTKNRISEENGQQLDQEAAREVLIKAAQENMQQFNLKLQALCEEHHVKVIQHTFFQIVPANQ